MGITSFTLNGLGVDAAVSGDSGTVPRPRNGVKGTSRGLGPRAGNSRLGGWDYQLLPNEETITVGERVFFEDRILRYPEAGSNSREGVPFAYNVTLLLTRSRDRRRSHCSGHHRER